MTRRSTASSAMICGIPVTIPNKVKESPNGDYYVSYNNYDIGTFGCDTTALVKGQCENFYILNGDHRDEYRKLGKGGFNACFDYFLAHRELMNKYSDDESTPTFSEWVRKKLPMSTKSETNN